MASPTRSILSPTASRVTTIIPNTTVISPRSISTRSQLEESISTLQSKIYRMFFFAFTTRSKEEEKKRERLWLIRDMIDRRAHLFVFKTKTLQSFGFFSFICLKKKR